MSDEFISIESMPSASHIIGHQTLLSIDGYFSKSSWHNEKSLLSLYNPQNHSISLADISLFH